MKKNYIVKIALLSTTLALASSPSSELTDLDRLNLKYMYEGAKEIDMLNRSMEAGMREHNQKIKPVLTTTNEKSIDKSPMDSFQDLGDKLYLEKHIEDSKDTKVDITIVNNMVKIVTKTTKKEHKITDNGMAESSYSSSTTEEIPIPFSADISKLKKEYRDGVIKIYIPKKKSS